MAAAKYGPLRVSGAAGEPRSAGESGPLRVSVPRDLVRVSGADAESFLQGQISQDVEAVGMGESAWSLVLDPRGKVDAWFRVTRVAGEPSGSERSVERESRGAGDLPASESSPSGEFFLLDLDHGFGERLLARLERFKLRVDVSIELLDGWRMVALRRAGDTSPGPCSGGTGVCVRVDWPGYEGFDMLGPNLAPDASRETLPAGGAAVESARSHVVVPDDGLEALREALELDRIRAGWPAMGRELTERTIPAEIAGLVEASVSFTKGCYVGQELVARIDSRGGNVPRHLRVLEIDAGAGVAPGDQILVDGKSAGEITSVAADPATGTLSALGFVHRRVELPARAAVAGRPAALRATPAAEAASLSP